MVALVSLEEAKLALRIDGTASDDDLEMKIEAASEAIVAYLKDAAEAFLDTAGEAIEDEVPKRVKQATIMLVGYYYRLVDGDPDKEFELGYLPNAVTALIYSMRTPTVA